MGRPGALSRSSPGLVVEGRFGYGITRVGSGIGVMIL